MLFVSHHRILSPGYHIALLYSSLSTSWALALGQVGISYWNVFVYSCLPHTAFRRGIAAPQPAWVYAPDSVGGDVPGPGALHRVVGVKISFPTAFLHAFLLKEQAAPQTLPGQIKPSTFMVIWSMSYRSILQNFWFFLFSPMFFQLEYYASCPQKYLFSHTDQLLMFLMVLQTGSNSSSLALCSLSLW